MQGQSCLHSHFFFFSICSLSETLRTAQGQPLPPDYGPPPYEALQPGFLPPHVPGEGPMPMPMPPPTQGATPLPADTNKHITHQGR